ncbi:hypothetical protein [Pseudomonas mosselii]|uniref:hypothetical protein n=1 Tax=Pseudomonas mosselii TaxID=78327 RepID=UPI00216370F1|nr:hypothetical protein [Pseudomonas mosselii]UVN46209.1 hypothetical protein NW905_09480 [Pseudomonas mosselii]
MLVGPKLLEWLVQVGGIMICALCQQQTEKLINSHLLPAAAYVHVRGQRSGGNRSPFKIDFGKGMAGPTDKQVRQKLLCKVCEDLFSKNGEKHVGRLWATKTSFPILELLSQNATLITGERFSIYDGLKLGKATVDGVFYFAISVFWRAQVWDWGDVGDGYGRALGQHYSEKFRRFLLGLSDLRDVYLLVDLNTDNETHGMMSLPSCSKVGGERIHKFMVPGMQFFMYVGRSLSSITIAPFIYAKANTVFISSNFSVSPYFRRLAERVQADKKLRDALGKP